MKLVTFNIRCDYEQDGDNNFCFRKPLILEKLQQEKPDVICFQEMLPHVAVWLKEALAEYYVIGCGRDQELSNEQMTVAYRKDSMNLIQMETYWLSETPYVPGSRYPEQSTCPRTCTEAVFEETGTRQIFRIVNTHLDHVGSLARQLAMRQIADKLERNQLFSQAPVIVAGDMNAEPDSEEIALMKNRGYANVTEGIGVTFHDYFREGPQECIDYIFTKGLDCESLVKWTDVRSGVYLSDHYPICAVLRASRM